MVNVGDEFVEENGYVDGKENEEEIVVGDIH